MNYKYIYMGLISLASVFTGCTDDRMGESETQLDNKDTTGIMTMVTASNDGKISLAIDAPVV